MNGTTYRKLTDSEIAVLEANGCSASGWSNLEVADGFSPANIHRCRFAGTVRLGRNVMIDGIHDKIENYQIGDEVTILHTESLTCPAKSAFGNGTRVAVLNETGGREVPVCNGLTAQAAYLIAMYRHRPEAVRAMEALIENETEKSTSELGKIGNGTHISHCGALTSVCTGENAVLTGVAELTNGTVNSSAGSPTRIGRGVIARDFIVADSAEVTDFAHIEKCFIGQGCRIGKGFTAENSLFFANCDCQLGEACSIFAGPYTVTHHKSTLLIGGMFSFYNAGSGSNQSNHMYRLGPVHQGILERGCKTGSSSYILFPALIGAFSVVTGRHYSHADTSALPFSYLVEQDKETVVIPGASLRSIGTARDAGKWPKRDRRRGKKRDRINFEKLNPYTMGEIREGFRLLETFDPTKDAAYNRTMITAKGIDSGRKIYRLAIDLFIGESLAEKLQESDGAIPQNSGKIYDRWCDLAGLILPCEEVSALLDRIPAMEDIDEVDRAFAEMEARYGEWCRSYAAGILEEFYKKPIGHFTSEDYTAVLQTWIEALTEQERLFTADANKEYGETMRIGYGLNGGKEDSSAEFASIHGQPGDNSFLQDLHETTRKKTEAANSLISRIKN